MDSTDLMARITVDQEIAGGRPCIRGTRVRVTDIVDMFASGAERLIEIG